MKNDRFDDDIKKGLEKKLSTINIPKDIKDDIWSNINNKHNAKQNHILFNRLKPILSAVACLLLIVPITLNFISDEPRDTNHHSLEFAKNENVDTTESNHATMMTVEESTTPLSSIGKFSEFNEQNKIMTINGPSGPLSLNVSSDLSNKAMDFTDGDYLKFTYKKNKGTYYLQTFSRLPNSKPIPVQYPGKKENIPASLVVSEQDYFFYLMDDYSISSEEPNKDMLVSEQNNDFFARIEKLPEIVDPIKVKKESKQLAEANGLVYEKKVDQLPHLLKGNVTHFFDSQNETLHMSVFVLKINSQFYRITLHLPEIEMKEVILPELYAMLNTIE